MSSAAYQGFKEDINKFYNSLLSYFQSSNDFLTSESIIAKLSLLLLVIITLIISIRVGISLISYYNSPSGSPHLIDGMVDGKQMKIISTNPNVKGSKPILRSVNENEGIEFTWSSWIFIDNITDYKYGEYKHVFHKGSKNINFEEEPAGLNFPNNAPGLYIAPFKNDLVVIMNTFKNMNEKIVVEDVPLNKWINVIIRVEDENVDVYINGSIVKRHVLDSVPKQNYDDVYMSMNGGFSGYSSNLWYYDYGLGTTAIQEIVDNGPDLKMIGEDFLGSKPRYFSLRWFFNNTDSNNQSYGGF